MTDVTCWNCNNTWQYEKVGSYPNGPCEIICSNCYKLCCPDCGGELNVESDCEEMRDYWYYEGCECGWEHCGGCV